MSVSEIGEGTVLLFYFIENRLGITGVLLIRTLGFLIFLWDVHWNFVAYASPFVPTGQKGKKENRTYSLIFHTSNYSSLILQLQAVLPGTKTTTMKYFFIHWPLAVEPKGGKRAEVVLESTKSPMPVWVKGNSKLVEVRFSGGTFLIPNCNPKGVLVSDFT